MSGFNVSAHAAALLFLSLLVQAFATVVSVGSAILLMQLAGPEPAMLLWAVATPMFIALCWHEATSYLDRHELAEVPVKTEP